MKATVTVDELRECIAAALREALAAEPQPHVHITVTPSPDERGRINVVVEMEPEAACPWQGPHDGHGCPLDSTSRGDA